MKALLVIILSLIAVPAMAETTRDWLCQRAPHWKMCRQAPPPAPPVVVAPAPAPAPTPEPVIVPPPLPPPEPVIVPVPAPTPPPKVKVPPKPKPKPREPKTKAVQISAADCAQIALGVSFLGVDGMKKKARERGYSNAQIAAAQRACGF